MTSEYFKAMCYRVLADIKASAPKDTGNLAYNSIKIEFPNDNTCEIYVDQNIAPYMVYTNEPWISDYWNRVDKNGNVYKLKNPNEHWWNKLADKIAQSIIRDLGKDLIRFEKV